MSYVSIYFHSMISNERIACRIKRLVDERKLQEHHVLYWCKRIRTPKNFTGFTSDELTALTHQLNGHFQALAT